MTQNMNTLAECFVAYVKQPYDVDFVETYDIKEQNSACVVSDWNFPNTEGGFQ